MLQLLIVDDHPDQVESMAQTIPWCNYGIESVYKAYSAHEALDYIKSKAIDIMITDIRMPEMNGLELIQCVRALSGKIKCVLMSGYSDFEYAKQAIQYKTAGYLMKPVDTQELTTLIEEIQTEFQREWNVNEVVQSALYTLRENIPFLRARLLSDLLQGKPVAHSALCKKLKTLDLRFDCDDYVCMMIIRLDGDSANEDEMNLSLMEYAVTNMAEEVFREAFTLWHCKDADGLLVFLARANKPWEQSPYHESMREVYLKQLEFYAGELQKKTRVYLKRKVSVLLMNQWIHLSGSLAAVYQTAVAGVRKQLSGEKQCLAVVSGDIETEQVSALQKLYEPPLLLHLLEAGRWDMAGDRLELIFAELDAKWRESPEYLSEAFFSIAGAFMRISHKNGKQLQSMIGEYGNKLQMNRPFSSLAQLREWVFHVLKLLRHETENGTNESKMTVVERIQAYIRQHMDGDASLQAIADHVGLHPAYLSKVYKAETGCGISDYVVKVKMDKAALLLRNKNEKIYNIAGQLGYQTTHYFIKVFKKYYGMTPQEFKLKQ